MALWSQNKEVICSITTPIRENLLYLIITLLIKYQIDSSSVVNLLAS